MHAHKTTSRFRRADGTFPPLAGGDQTADLMPRVRELNSQITQQRQAASQQWEEFERTRTELAGSDAVNDPESPAFQAAEQASRTYSETAENVRHLEDIRERLLAMTSGARPDANANGNGPQDGDHDPRVNGARGRSMVETAAQRVLASDEYRHMRETGLLRDGSKARIGDRVLAQGMSRDELHAHFRGMGRPQAALVTGADDASGGALVVNDRQPDIVPLRFRPLRLVDMITVGQTDSDTVEYVEMTGFTNNAAETAEATATAGTSGTKPESALAMALRTANVRTIAHWIPATKRALADAGQLRTLIDGLLRLGLDLRLDQQVVSGDGVGENLRGIRNTVGIGVVNRVEAASGNTLTPEAVLDAIHRAITTVRVSFFEPTAIGIHPSDYEIVRLARTGKPAVANTGTTAGSYGEGEYLMGDPSQAGAERIWGLVPVVSAAFPAGFPLIGDYAQAVLWLREGTQVLASDTHMDFFVRNLVAILAELRTAFGVIAPAAFCEAQIA